MLAFAVQGWIVPALDQALEKECGVRPGHSGADGLGLALVIFPAAAFLAPFLAGGLASLLLSSNPVPLPVDPALPGTEEESDL
jgi:hypothetical protein